MYRKWKEQNKLDQAAGDALSDKESFIRRILNGDIATCETAVKRALRLFVSSTFTDTKPERNYLMRETYPQIRAYCEKRGIQFSTVDLRWGIRDSSTNDHLTAEICLAEINKCREVSIDAPSFLLLSFNKYGSPSLPRTIQADEFELLFHQLEKGNMNTEVKELLHKWYKCDNNSIPPVRVLQPISSQIPEYGIAKDVEEQKRLRKLWWNIEEKMLQALIQAAQNCEDLSAMQKLKWKLSTTHQEVQQGVVSEQSNSSNSLCYMRDIEEFENLHSTSDIKIGKKILGRHIDLSPDRTKVDEEIAALREKMREEVKSKGVACKKYRVNWAEDGILETTHREYMKEFAEHVKSDLLNSIKKAMDSIPKLNSCLKEAATHMTFCNNRATTFHGRDILINAGLNYFKDANCRQQPLVIHGISGSGKTSLMAKLAMSCRNVIPKNKMPLLITRLCGTSPASSSAISLMKSLTEHIEWFFTQEQPELNDNENFRTVIKNFHKSLNLSTEKQPLLLFIDSLDQLNDDNQGRSQLSWLPSKLPKSTFLIVSTLPDVGGCLSYLKAHTYIPAENYLEVAPVSIDDASSIVQGWLNGSKRTLRTDQLNNLLSAATDTSIEPPTMLRLKLMFDMSKKWASYDDVVECPVSVRGLINRFLGDLETVHGEILVSHLFGLIAISKQGLGESELLDILSGDEEVLNSVLQYHKPPIRRLPQIVFARLRNAVGEYMVERGTNQGKLVLSWYHRQFWEAAEWRYLYDSKYVKNYANMIASYFSMEMHNLYPERRFIDQQLFRSSKLEESSKQHEFNESKIWELPSALLTTKRFKEFEEQICNLTFIAAAVESGIARNLIAVLREAVSLHSPEIRVIPPFKMHASKDAIARHKRLEAYSMFLATNMHIFQKQPKLVHQQAMNMPRQSLVQQDALNVSTQEVYPWSTKHLALVTLINKPEGKIPCLFTMSAHDEAITDIARPVSSPRDMELVLTACKAGLIICYNLVTGSVVITLNAGCGVTRLALLNQWPSGTQFDVLASCYNGTVKSWTISFETGQASSVPNLTWHAHDGNQDYVMMALSSSTQYLVTGTSWKSGETMTGSISLWDLDEIGQNGRPSCLIKKSDIDQVDPRPSSGTFGVSFLAFSPLGNFVIVALGRNQSLEVQRGNMISICSSKTLEPLYVIPDVMHQPQWIDIRPFKWWIPTHRGENIWSMLVSTNCSQMRIAVSSCPDDDIKSKVLWVHETDYDFHSSVLHKLEKTVISGLGCNVKIWDVPNISPVCRDKWDTWDTSENKLDLHNIDTFRGHGHTVQAVHVSDHDNLVCTGATNGVLKVWQLSKIREYEYPPMHKYGISACTVANDGSVLVTGCDRGRLTDAEIRLWKPATGELLKILKEDVKHKVIAISFSPDNKILCYRTNMGNSIQFVDVESFTNGLGTNNGSFTVNLGDNSQQLERVWGRDNLDWSSTGKYVLATSSATTKIWFVNVMEKTASHVQVHDGIVLGGRFSPDDKNFATWCSAFSTSSVAEGPDTKSEIKLFDFTIKKLVSKYVASPEYTKVISDKDTKPVAGITTAQFLPFQSSLVAATTSGHILILDTHGMVLKQVISAHSHSLNTIKVLSHKSKPYIITGFSKIRIWDGLTLEEVAVYHNGALVTCLTGCSNPDDGKLYVQVGDTIGKLFVLKVDLLVS